MRGDGLRNLIFGWLLTGLAIAILTAGYGCASKAIPARPAPPHPRSIGTLTKTVTAQAIGELAAPAAPVAPKNYRLEWDWTGDTNGISFEVWRSVNLTGWTLKTNTTARALAIRADLPKEFYRVRTKRTVGTNIFYSGWNVK